MITETLITHGGDLIEWRESSGYVDKPPRRIAPTALKIEFSKAPKSLRIYHKTNGTLLWHKESSAPSKVVPGKASEEDLAVQPAIPHAIEGHVSDPTGHYLPRTFAFTLGNTSEHRIALYHSPLGARFSKAGGIYGCVAFEDKTIAAWALIQLTVTPSLGAPLKFAAQADAYGEFRLPLDRLPALTKDAHQLTYAAKLEVKASKLATPESPLDLDLLPPVKLAKGKDSKGKSVFANALDLTITPGTVTNVTSPKHPMITLKS
ncbi:MAG: hypothetical protein HYS20_00505 [Rhodocyclales bacterium]|nr:hypothetical protein [Rhodocyclales bacterium]